MKTEINDVEFKKCQIFTPDEIVEKMLVLAKYNDSLIGKKVLENSCGDGQILAKIVVSYIENARKELLPDEEIIKGLENDITAFDIDPEQVKNCQCKLSDIASLYGLNNIKWNIICEDFLKSKNLQKYDYIIGNPPYIAYPDLKETTRKYVKEHFKTCKKGKFDYCYAFIEKSYELLSEGGVMIYIIPSSIFKNVFAYEIRSLIKDELELIFDYPNEKVFKNVLVSPAIIKVKKGKKSYDLRYILNYNGKNKEKNINKSSLGEKWIFYSDYSSIGKRVGDYFRVSSSIATLLNEAFLISNCTFDNKFCYFNGTKIEKAIIKKAASPKNKKYEKEEYIIFPYYYDSKGFIKHYSESQMREKFPLTLAYLERNKKKLENRKADKNAAWYMYGRSQALQNSNKEMILISSVISDCTKAYMLSAEEIPYSGLYIIPTGNIPLNRLLVCLNTDAFIKHIQNVGICVNGKSRRITPKDIESFIFETE